MNFFKKIKASFYNPVFYSGQKTTKAGTAFWYFIRLIALVILLETVVMSIIVIPVVRTATSDESLNSLVSYFPKELKITIKDGHASTNVTEPYSVPMIDFASSTVKIPTKASTSTIENILVIDTNSSGAIERFAEYKTLALLTKDFLITKKDDRSSALSVQPLSGVPNMIVDRQFVVDSIDKFKPLIGWIIPIIIAGFFLGMLFVNIVANIITNAVFSLVVLIIEKIKKTNISYGEIFKLGFYGLTGPIIISFATALFMVSFTWYIYGLLFLLFMFINLRLPPKA